MGTRNGPLSVYIPRTKGIIETRHIEFAGMIIRHSLKIDLEINEPKIIGLNEVRTRQLTLTDDTHDKNASGQNKVQEVSNPV